MMPDLTEERLAEIRAACERRPPMFDPPIDNWTQADEDCFECKHRLALGDELTKLQAELAAERGLRLAMERQAIGIEDACRARINDTKAILTEAMRANRVQPWPKAGILGLCKQVAQTLAHWSRVIGSRDEALKEVHAARREAELGRQQLQEFIAADVENLKLLRLDHTGLMISGDKSYGMRLVFWSLYQAVKDCVNYQQTEVEPPRAEGEMTLRGQRMRYFLTVVKPGGKSPHELRAEAEAERESLRAEFSEAGGNCCEKCFVAYSRHRTAAEVPRA